MDMKFPFLSPAFGTRAGRRRGAEGFTPLDIDPARDEELLEETRPSREKSEGRKAGLPPIGSIGAILVDANRLSAEDARRVVATQLESDAPFGETAIKLGLATPADIEYALSRQFSMPRLEREDSAVDREVLAAFQPDHELVESLRVLRSQIALRALDAVPALRSVAVMGSERGIGRSYIAANLAIVFAQLGARTLLIDADLVHARQHCLFKLSNRMGLSSILAGRATLSAVAPIAGLPGFAVLPAGPKPPNPQDLLARPLFSQFLRRCEQDFDIVLLDTPAWSLGSSARMVAAAAGAALLLAQTGKTGAEDASEISHEIASTGARLIGVALNRR
jgi:chain length determinant protein tyrosine kinase EpsG